jgi:tryptophanyl-tRNA synthetase
VKQRLACALNAFVEPIREGRRSYARNHTLVDDILSEGSCKACSEAQKTIEEVRQALQLYGVQ